MIESLIDPADVAAGEPVSEPSPSLVTRREPDGFATRREARAARQPEETGQTRQTGQTGPDDVDVLIGLPAVLRARYQVIKELPNPGTEADVLLVREAPGLAPAAGPSADDRRVVKLYRQGIKAEPEVWEKVRSITSLHVVRIVDTGTAAGRDYEVMEFLPGGNLTELAPGAGVGLSAELVTEVARQVASGLIELHGQGIVHRDLKPENVLIRRTSPLELVVTDFGLSRVHQESMVAASRSGTMAYLAPEILLSTGAVSSKARDWWALGMMVRELLTGVRPFEEMTAKGIDRALMLRGVDLGNIEDPRMRLFCRGLLVRDMEDRWGAEQVLEWLRGGSPAVADEAPAAADELKPFTFEGQQYREKKALARAFGRSWEKAARRYFVGMGTDTDSSEGWLALRTWLQQFSNPEIDDVEGLVELIDDRLKPTQLAPDVKLLSLVRWLDPNLPALYRGQSLAREHLPALAAQAAIGDGADQVAAARVVQDLHTYQLLPVLAQMQGGAGLADVDAQWRVHLAAYDERAGVLAQQLPAEARSALAVADTGRRRAQLLSLAVDPVGEAGRMRDNTATRATMLPVPVPWFDALARTAGAAANPIDDLIAAVVFPVAARAAEELAAVQRQQEEAEQRRRQVWKTREQKRLAGAGAAASKAWLYLGTSLGIMLLLFVVGLGRGALMNIVSAAVGLAVAAYLVLSELDFARRLGTDYTDFTVLGGAGARIRSIGQQIRGAGPGGGFALLIGGIIVIALAISWVFIVYGALGGFHAWTLNKRNLGWQARHDEERREGLNAG